MDQSLPPSPVGAATTPRSGETRPSSERPPAAASAPFRQRPRRGRLGAVASDREIFLLGQRAFERGDVAAALEHFDRLIAHDVHFADVHCMIGRIREGRGDLEGALTHLREAIRLNPSYVEALLALATLHERRGEFDRAQGYAERASQLSRPTAGGLDPTTRGKLANQQADLADALVEAGERRDAIEQYRGALERCPTFHDIRHRLGRTLREAGLPAQAASEFQRILRLQPQLLDSQIQLGLTWYSMGRTGDAIAEWEAVLEKDPSRDEARMYLRLVRGQQRSTRVRDAAAATDPDAAPSTDTPTSKPKPTPTPTPRSAPTPDAPDVAASNSDVEIENEGGGEPELSFRAVESPKPPAVSGWKTTDLARGRGE